MHLTGGRQRRATFRTEVCHFGGSYPRFFRCASHVVVPFPHMYSGFLSIKCAYILSGLNFKAMALSGGGACFDRPEIPRHAPGVERNDDQNIQRHSKNDVEHGHKEHGFLQDQGLQQDL